MLTLNSAGGLHACLESLKDFQEIIVCDGNSTDRTQDIARLFGARITKQYDTDEPDTPCAMDKAAVRERAMAASSVSWRFFMDSDDTLSPEAIDEIRAIVTAPHPAHVVWRMPTRIFIGGKEVKHEATYPSYQTRLVHESVGAHFRGPVHERLVFDEKRFSVGTMRSFYNFHWSQERVADYWGYLRTYARRELQTTRFTSFGNFFYWGIYRRLRTILGYVLWRLPAMYLRHGFKDSMPLSIELTIVRYHFSLLFGSIALYFKTRTWFVLFVETLKGKDLNRTLGNLTARMWEGYGRVFDVGGGDGKSSYWRFIKHHRWHRIINADVDPKAKPQVLADLEKDTIPFPPGYFNTAIMCNVIEHLDAREEVLRKVYDALAPQGTLYGIVPFLVGVHPNPHDYVRVTNEGLGNLLTRAGFTNVKITPIGRGPFVASYYQSEFILPRLAKLFVLPVVLGLDRILLTIRPNLRNTFPLSYAFTAQK